MTRWPAFYDLPTEMGLVPEGWPAHVVHPADDLCYYVYRYHNLQSSFDVYIMSKAPENLELIADLGDMFIIINQKTNSES